LNKAADPVPSVSDEWRQTTELPCGILECAAILPLYRDAPEARE